MANGNVVATGTAGSKVTEYTVYPAGDTTIYAAGETPDRHNVNFAIDGVADGGTVVLKRHRINDDPHLVTAFNFGGDDQEMRIFVTKNVTIRGDESPMPEWNDPQGWSAGVAENGGTTITGGRSIFVIGLDPVTAALKPVSVKIRDIRFKKFYRSAIRTFASKNQNEISGCSFVEYQVGQVGDPPGAFPFVVDSSGAPVLDIAGNPVIDPATGEAKETDPAPDILTGNLKISRNFIGTPPTAAQPAGMNNLVHVSNCNLIFEFSNNRITDMYWVGIAVYANKGKTTISGNHITKNRSFFLEGAGISVGTRPLFKPTFPPEGNQIVIEGNLVEVGSGNSSGISLFLLNDDFYQPPAPGSSGIRVSGNTVQMEGESTQERAALACLGACSKSKWENNVIKGMAHYGIWVSDHAPSFVSYESVNAPELRPSKNIFQDNDLRFFTATKSQVFIGETVENLKLFKNKFGGVSNTSVNGHKPPLDDAVSEVRCKGRLGEISQNEFQNSAARGWTTSPEWVGCIYLDKESQDNKVQYRDSEFPTAAVPPLTDEIFDAGTGNHIVRLGP